VRHAGLAIAETIVGIERVAAPALEQAIESSQAQRIARRGSHFCRYNYPEGIILYRRKALAETAWSGEQVNDGNMIRENGLRFDEQLDLT
jgi:hypothetical protein